MATTNLRILDIVEGTSVDGPGLRTSIYIAGCSHQCPGCHNRQSWDFNGGKQLTVDEIVDIVEANDFNVTLSGGDPMYHPHEIAELCKRIKQKLGKTIWCYTGFTWEEIVSNEKLQLPLPWIDVVVEGRFIERLRDTCLRFKGSSNQRIISVAPSLQTGTIHLATI